MIQWDQGAQKIRKRRQWQDEAPKLLSTVHDLIVDSYYNVAEFHVILELSKLSQSDKWPFLPQSTLYENSSETIPSKDVFREIGDTWGMTGQSMYEAIAQEAQKILDYSLGNVVCEQTFGQEHKLNMSSFITLPSQFQSDVSVSSDDILFECCEL
ncbi:11793_t:CDS:2 [Ambispora leptoticha]|uniref:11793_t:CDS:1 n=1 Tax=Ambispora leptoticha TaxID=144679 RepID=A0A9N9FTF2_9GLOM|nr:11793_t:CDS:2 [Ambispora leptoticha]